MRILFVTPFLPAPCAPHGGGGYLGSLSAALAERAELGLVHLEHPGEHLPAQHPWSWRRAAIGGRPTGAKRIPHALRMLWHWPRRPLLAAKAWNPGIRRALEAARREFRPDVALVELAQMAQYVPFLRGTPTVFTDHEAGVPANTKTGLGRMVDRWDAGRWPHHLRRSTASAALVQALTDEDAAALADLLGRDVRVRPPAIRLPERPSEPGAAPARALFLGDYRHAPNREAAGRLVADVLPRVRARVPAAELWLAGPHDEAIAALAGAPGVRRCGFVADLEELMGQVRLVLSPVWTGGGFRVKTATALAHGVPVVTNDLGARGCRAPAPACTVAEQPEGLAEAAVRLLADPDLAACAGREARGWAQQHLAPSAVAALQFERLERLVGADRPA